MSDQKAYNEALAACDKIEVPIPGDVEISFKNTSLSGPRASMEKMRANLDAALKNEPQQWRTGNVVHTVSGYAIFLKDHFYWFPFGGRSELDPSFTQFHRTGINLCDLLRQGDILLALTEAELDLLWNEVSATGNEVNVSLCNKIDAAVAAHKERKK